MIVFLSFLPILSTVLALTCRIRPLQAALIGLGTTIVAIFPLSSRPPAELLLAVIGWAPVLTEVLLIVAGGLLLSQVLRFSGAQAAIAQWLVTRRGQGLASVLLVVHGVTPFAEALTGFGIGVTVGIPLLLHFGLSRSKAAVVGLLGLCAVPWGSMGPGTLIAASMSGLPFQDLGLASAILSIIPFVATGMIAGWLVRPDAYSLAMGAFSGFSLTVAVAVANAIFGTAPAGATGSLALIAMHLLSSKGGGTPLSQIGRRGVFAYAVLLGGVLAMGIGLKLIGGSGNLRFLASPALWLFMAVLWFNRGRLHPEAGSAAWRSWCSVAPVTSAFILLGVLMSVSGMAAQLAEWLAGSGQAYAFLSPFIAAAGGFITGSNTGANAMLASTQAEIARHLNANILWYMAAHNVAAAFLLMASPGKVEMAVQLAEVEPDRAAIQSGMLKIAGIVTSLLALVGGAMSIWL